MKLTKSTVLAALIVLFSFNLSFAYKRVVLLAPDVADIFHKLNLDNVVVGKTKNVKLFKNAKIVGTHLSVNTEILISLKPDLIVARRKTEFDASKLKGVKILIYNPHTLKGIIKEIKLIGKMFNRGKKAEELTKNLLDKIKQLKPIKHKPKVVFEIMQTPYLVAGKKCIVNDIIQTAGGINIINKNRMFVRTLQENILLKKPDIYIYEVGPMNKNPTPPNKRAIFKDTSMLIVKVDESKFLRSNTVSFDSVVYLNNLFYEWSKNRK
ncbi:ABC transporter substrate-binding protein [Hippea alviniae]|uniref:ABC transporter substrate-binding protein n=1 Tax=Hippea alviniae TaxID=1279027 RepID=UPI0003B3CB92|nr:ABC transporter substrate-binding protein [Hippea alviniae]